VAGDPKHSRVTLLLLLCGMLAGCGESHPRATQSIATEGTRNVPQELTRARETRSCKSLLQDQACTYYDRIESWLRAGTLQSRHVAGAVALVEDGCVTCHTYRNIGTQNLAAPDLTNEGAVRNATEIGRIIVCPQCVKSSSSMPPFKALPRRSIDELAAFLASSRR
jgi:hypothetical protein